MNNVEFGYKNEKDELSFDLEEVVNIASRYFSVIDYYISDKTLVIKIVENNVKQHFLNFYNEIRKMGLVPFIDKSHDQYEIRVTKSFFISRGSRKISVLLLFATFITVMMDGYMRSINPYLHHTIPNYNPVNMTILFTISLLGIIGIHELGHKVALYINKIRASWPYFIPGIPGVFPTFGAVITQEELPPNRDKLFDLGIAGPLTGFLTTIIVTIYAVMTAPIISIEQLEQLHKQIGGEILPFPVPILYLLIQNLLRPVHEGYVVLIDPLTWASIVGMLITALNIFPAWQLDGGHLARAVLGPRYHKYATIISILILFVVGYYLMALFIWFMYILSKGLTIRPLDDASPVSHSRKILFILSWVIAALCLPLPQIPI